MNITRHTTLASLESRAAEIETDLAVLRCELIDAAPGEETTLIERQIAFQQDDLAELRQEIAKGDNDDEWRRE